VGGSVLKSWRLKSDDKLFQEAKAARNMSAELNVHIPGHALIRGEK
jgi:hypothetical protein